MPPPPATPKQVAYLRYLGVRIPPGLTVAAASILIDEAHDAADEPGNDALSDRVYGWAMDRGRLHPDLYPDEAGGLDAPALEWDAAPAYRGKAPPLNPWVSGAIWAVIWLGLFALIIAGLVRFVSKLGDAGSLAETTAGVEAITAETTAPIETADPPPNPYPTETRTWTALDGRTILAQAIAFDGQAVTLRRADGTEFPGVRIDTLSTEDQAYLHSLGLTAHEAAR